jgi:hypothetical protein
LHDLGSCKTLPVEIDRVEEAGERGSELREELDGVGSDEEALDTVLLEADDWGGKDVLKGVVTCREVA